MNKTLEMAVQYVNAGFKVLPCYPNGKRPDGDLVPHSFYDASDDEEIVIEWWTQKPNANLALSTEGLIVVDVDMIDRAKGIENPWPPHVSKELMQGAVAKSPSGGTHYFFKKPEGLEIGISAGKVAKGVDIRTDGGIILVEPSTVKDKSYKWIPGFELESDLPEPPVWLVEELKKRSSIPVDLGGEGNRIPHGHQHDTLFRFACAMRRNGASTTEINAALQVVNQERCEEPGTSEEIERIARDAGKYEPDQFSVAVLEDHFGQDVEQKKPNNDISDPGTFPQELLEVPGYLSDVMAYNLEGAIKPQPELALSAALCLLSVLTGRKIADEYDTRTNVYCLGVCQSGGGKERARQVNKRILQEAGADGLIGPEGIGSHAGLVTSIAESRVALYQLDEIGRFLKTVNGASVSPHLYHIITVLMKLFTSANSLYIGDAYADSSKIKQINQPHAVLYGTTVPQSLYEGLTAESLTDGFLSRVMVFEADNHDPETQKIQNKPVPERLLSATKYWFEFNPGGNLSAENPQPLVVEHTVEAEKVFRALDEQIKVERTNNNAVVLSQWTRTSEKARKLALLYACSRNFLYPEIDEDAAQWACELSKYLTRKILFIASDWISETPFDAKCKRALRTIKEAGKAGISKGVYCRRMQHLKRQEREEIIETLLETGQICTELSGTKGPPKTTYKLSVFRDTKNLIH